jgi:ATP-dependent Clp protease ATP-binding subunit ClpX
LKKNKASQDTCVICSSPVEPELDFSFEFNEEIYYFCESHAEPFRMGLSLGQLEINHKFVTLLSSLPEPITRSDIKKQLMYFVPMSRIADYKEINLSSPELEADISISTPKEFYNELSKVVIGQEQAKKAISVSVINHLNQVSETDFTAPTDKNHVLMLGKSGSGKTLIANTTANLLNLPFVSGDATGFSPTGFHGADVDSVCYDLLIDTEMNFDLAEKGVVFIDEIDKICFDSKSSGKYESFVGSTQATFLKLVEGKMIKVPGQLFGDPPGTSVNLSSEKMLFFFGGAFNGLAEIIAKKMGKTERSLGFLSKDNDKINKLDESVRSYEIFAQASREELVESLIEFGMLSELIGRIPTIVPLKPLSKEDLKNVLLDSKTSAILKQIKNFERCGFKLEFTDDFIEKTINLSYESATGTRALDSYVKKAVSIASFDLLSTSKASFNQDLITINSECLSEPHKYQKSKLHRATSTSSASLSTSI